MKTKIVVFACIFGVGILALAAESQTPPPAAQVKSAQSSTATTDSIVTAEKDKYSSKFGSHLEPILKAISASKEQRQSISKVVEEFRPELEPMRQKYREEREQFLKALSHGGTSRESADTLMNCQLEMSRLQGEISRNYLLMQLKIRKCMTPEQLVRFEDYRKKQGWKAANNN